MTIRCEITTQERDVFSGDVDMVILPGVNGQMGILPHHCPLLTVLEFGVIIVRKGKEESIFTVGGGLAEVQPDQVTVLADSAEDIANINLERELEARKLAEASLIEAKKKPRDQYLEAQAALRRTDLYINAYRKFRSRQRR